MNDTNNSLVVGTRGSLLARSQTQWVVDRLKAAHPQLDIRTEIITTAGDRDQTQSLPEIGAKGLFTVELEQALSEKRIDLAVHSAKDLPSVFANGLDIVAYPAREDPRDAWISAGGAAFDDLPANSVVGTSSLRRQAQLLMRRNDLTFIALRGNVDTRIKKVRRGDCAGAVLAMAGLKRSGLIQHMTHPFDPTICLPAPGQGALAIEGRGDDQRVRSYLAAIDDRTTAIAVGCERAILAELDAGCRAPIAILATSANDKVRCEARVADPQGRQCIRVVADGAVQEVVARILAELRAAGAEAIIAACRE